MFVKNGATLVAALSLLACVDAKRQQLSERGSRCNGDNLLNRFRGAKYSAAAISFCQTYINSLTYSVVTVSTDEAHVATPITTYSTAYPTPLLTTSYAASRLSSACSCVSPSAVTAVVTEYVASVTPPVVEDPATTSTTSTDDPATTSTDDPATTSTDDPATTPTDDPTTSPTSDPVATSTDDPVTTPTDDPTTTPTDPATTSTDDPATTSTDDPATTSTDDPATTSTDDPATTSTDDPATTSTDDPTTTPTDPTATDPTTTDPTTTDPTTTDPTTTDPTTTPTADPTTSPTDDPTTPTTTPSAPIALGCYVEGTGARALKTLAIADDSLTVEACAAACSTYTFYGVEYGRECYCGDTIDSTSFLSLDQTACNMPCKGDLSETCGGSSLINIYGPAESAPPPTQESPFTFLGCFAEPAGGRALPQIYASNKMTIEVCQQTCSLAGYSVAGLEYSFECWCGHEVPTLLPAEGACTAVCAGDDQETCGGNNALQLYAVVD